MTPSPPRHRSNRDLRALLVGAGEQLMRFMPELLYRAGFIVDVIPCSDLMQHSRFVERVDRVSSQPTLIKLAAERSHDN